MPSPQLPNALIIIIHLHLLDYPLRDTAGYSERLFDSNSVSIRERMKTMEDICYFLVGKVEGGKERAKAILPSYPCLQPSDTTAFRISLSKYLEALRHSIVHSSSTGDKAESTRPNGKQPPAASAAIAWWWKDVVVRKSLLEECCGDRFERLILALSTFAVLTHVSHLSALQQEGDLLQALNSLPQAYSTLISQAESARHVSERAAAVLIQRQIDLATLRERLADPNHASSSKYDLLSTERLLALRESRYQELLRDYWKDAEGERALQLVMGLAGLRSSASTITHILMNQTSPSGAIIDQSTVPKTVVSPTPPLPIAAAHHPAHLQALNAPLFSSRKPSTSSGRKSTANCTSAQEHPVIDLSEDVESVRRTQQAFKDALGNAQRIREELATRLGAVQSKLASGSSAKKRQDKTTLKLWIGTARNKIDFNISPTPALLSTFSLPPSPSKTALEARIAHIRTELLPAFPPIPSISQPVSSDPVAPLAPQTTRLRQPSSKGNWQVSAPPVQGVPEKGPVKGTLRKGHTPRRSHATTKSKRAVVGRASRAAVISRKPVGEGKKIGPHRTSPKASRRKSVAQARGSSAPDRRKDVLDDEVLRIADTVLNKSDSFDSTAIPKGKSGTIGTLLSTVKKSVPRQSYDIERAFKVPLPSLEIGDRDTDWSSDGEEAECKHEEEWVDDDDAEGFYEGKSVTLRDILLQAGGADQTQFNLLGDDNLEELSDWE